MELTHFNDAGRAHMVNVGGKPPTERVAKAHAKITMHRDTLRLIQSNRAAKGNVLAVAEIAGIQAAKRTWELIPLCHPLALTGIDIAFDLRETEVHIEATVRCVGVTGVEMEALTAASVTALTIYDMCKAAQKDTVISDIYLLEKSGGKSGDWRREGEA